MNTSSRPLGGGVPLTERLAQFKSRFQEMIGRKTEGYSELSQGLMTAQDQEDARAGFGSSGDYQGPVPGDEFRQESTNPTDSAPPGDFMGRMRAQQPQVPSQADDMREVAALANEAGELLWEMVAENELGDGAKELREKAQQLQAQLRGLIGDYQDSDEESLEAGLKALSVLNNVLEEDSNPTPSQGAGDSRDEASGAAGAPVADTSAPAGTKDSVAAPSAPHVPPPNLMDPLPADERPLMDI